jgi:hypothetical protein
MAVLEMLVLSQSGLKGFDDALGEIDFIINYFLPKIPPLLPSLRINPILLSACSDS